MLPQLDPPSPVVVSPTSLPWWPGCSRPHPIQLRPWLNELSILTKDLTIARLGDVMTLPQSEFVDQCQAQLDSIGQIRQVVLKARQMGFSTIIEGIGFILAMRRRNLQGRILSHRGDSSEHILGMMKRYWQTYPFKAFHVEEYAGKKQLSWSDRGSNIQVMTAGSKESGRSGTIQFLHMCLAPGTLVSTSSGMLPVEETLGRFVRTHTGAMARVSHLSALDDRPLVQVNTWCAQPMLVTPEHKFPVSDGSIKRADQLTKGDLLVHPVRRIEDHGLTPLLPEGVGRRRTHDGLPVPLNEETGFAIGYFIAEGSIAYNKGKRPASITFSRHRDEKTYADRAINALSGLFQSRRTTDRPDSFTSQDTIYSAPLAEWLVRHVGRNAWDKTIPEWAWSAGEEFCRGLLAGYLSGDGSKCDVPVQGYACHRIAARTVSRNLAYDMRELALSLGFGWGAVRPLGVRQRYGRDTREAWDVIWNGSSARSLRTLLGLPVTNIVGRPRTEKVRVVDGRALIPVRGVVDTGQRSKVYDIEVDHPDHTFIAADYATSNSEVAFYLAPETLMTGLRQAIPGFGLTAVFLESTANGVGNYFHQQYTAAKKGTSEFQAMFFPWWRHPEYTTRYLPAHERDKYVLGELDKEEQSLKSKYQLTNDRLIWRRWAIQNLCMGDLERFHQEYPSDDREAFISTGRNVYPLPLIIAHALLEHGRRGRLTRDRQQRITFTPDPDAHLTIYRPPSADKEWGVYLIGADPTHTTAGDWACAQVINRRTLEQVAVYRRKTDPITFARDLDLIGRYYNNALVAPEKTGPGYSTVGTLAGLDYPTLYQDMNVTAATQGIPHDTYGWATNVATKHMAISHLLRALKDPITTVGGVVYGLVIHDEQTAAEMRDYITTEDGRGYTNGDGSPFDDGVMAMAIALTVHNIEAPVEAYRGRSPHELPANVANRPVGSKPVSTPAPMPAAPPDDAFDPDSDPTDSTPPWEAWGKKD